MVHHALQHDNSLSASSWTVPQLWLRYDALFPTHLVAERRTRCEGAASLATRGRTQALLFARVPKKRISVMQQLSCGYCRVMYAMNTHTHTLHRRHTRLQAVGFAIRPSTGDVPHRVDTHKVIMPAAQALSPPSELPRSQDTRLPHGTGLL